MVPMQASTTPLVQLTNVRIERGGRTILRDVSLQVPQGSIGGIDFGARGPGLYADLIADSDSDSAVKFVAGPLFRVRLDRNRNIKDPVVRLLGKEDVAIEVGATVGVAFIKVINPFDNLAFSTDIQWDVAGAHKGRLISPSVSYSTPLSTAIFTSLSLSATHVDGNYADTYFSIDPVGSAASGLPQFNADGGWKIYGANLLGAIDLSGDARDGGFQQVALILGRVFAQGRQHGLAARLVAAGADPLQQGAAESAVNRRVEIRRAE